MQPLPEDWQTAAVVVAHPDDVEYFAASAVARWTSHHKKVSYVIATSGEAGIDGTPPEEAGPIREAEQRRSAEVVGVNDVYFLDHADGSVEYGLRLRADLCRMLRRIRPEIVLAMNFELTWSTGGVEAINHADHRATGLALMDACRDASNRWQWPDLGEPWTGIQAAYVSGVRVPTHFVDVTETIDAGVASLREHRLYLEGLGRNEDPEDFLRLMYEFGGAAAGCELAVLLQQFRV